MFCPQCGSTQSDELKYCKTCGANLQALRQVMAAREGEENYDWGRTWVAEMFMSQDEKDRVRGLTADDKRRREIKAGVITASAGFGLMILLFVLMNGIVLGGRVSDAAAEILVRLWIVGILPVLVGAALIFNGIVVSKKDRSSTPAAGERAPDTQELQPPLSGSYIAPGNPNELNAGIPFSVTDRTTRHLEKQPREKS